MSRVEELREEVIRHWPGGDDWRGLVAPFAKVVDELIEAAREEGRLLERTEDEDARIADAFDKGKALGKAEGEAEQWVKYYADYLQRRGIEDVSDACERCYGFGYRSYPSTATWRGGVGGQAITGDVCDWCWGSGSKLRPWRSWRAAQPTSEPAKAEALLGKYKNVVGPLECATCKITCFCKLEHCRLPPCPTCPTCAGGSR